MDNIKIKIEYQDEDVIIEKAYGIGFFMNLSSDVVQVRLINELAGINGEVLNQYYREKPVEAVKIIIGDNIIKNITNISHGIYKFTISDMVYESIDFIMKESGVNGVN
jgi:hypothetical protein